MTLAGPVTSKALQFPHLYNEKTLCSCAKASLGCRHFFKVLKKMHVPQECQPAVCPDKEAGLLKLSQAFNHCPLLLPLWHPPLFSRETALELLPCAPLPASVDIP